METPNEPRPLTEALADLMRARGWTVTPPPTAEELAEQHAARQALGPEYADCFCLGKGGAGEQVGVVLDRDADGTPQAILYDGEQQVYTWERICSCPDGETWRTDIERKRAQGVDALRGRRVARLLGGTGIRPATAEWGLSIEQWANTVREQGGSPVELTAIMDSLDAWRADVQARRDRVLLLLAGNWGVGKSWLASILVAEAATQLRTALYRTAPQIIDELSEARFRPPEDDDGTARTRSRVLRAYQDADLLAIDDLGIEAMTPYTADTVREVWFTILEERMMALRPTIVTTNRTREEIDARYGVRVSDRLGGRNAHRVWLMEPNLRAPRAEA